MTPPLVGITQINCAIQTDAHALLEQRCRPVIDPAAEEIGHHADQQIAHRERRQIQPQRLQTIGDTEIDEQLARVDVREHAIHRVAAIRRGGVITGLVALRHEAPQTEGHRIAKNKRTDDRQNQIAGNRIARRFLRQPLDALLTDEGNHRIHHHQQGNQQRQNPRHHADEHLAALLKQADKPLGPMRYRIHKHTSYRQKKNPQRVTALRNTDFTDEAWNRKNMVVNFSFFTCFYFSP